LSNFLFAFIISGAVAHVSWNVFLKKTEHKIAFTRGFTLMGSVLLLPTLFFMGPINTKAIPYFIGSIIIHVFYKIYLCRVYGFSVHNVASVAALREVSILFASIYGFFFLKEKIGLLGIIAGFLIFSGTVLIKLFS
jgi:drug/metabolite transporter (DMT)-like permease